MGFFATFSNWLDLRLALYIGVNTMRLENALEPAIAALCTLYVMIWGYLLLSGGIQEPFVSGLKRVFAVGAVLSLGRISWLYNQIIVDTFYTAPAELMAAVIGAPDPVSLIDQIWNAGGGVAGTLWAKFHALSFNFGFMCAALITWIMTGLLCVYIMFLVALSKIVLAVLLALGPLFLLMLLFSPTRPLFQAWIAQLCVYAFITIITVMAAALLLQIVNGYAVQTAALGSSIHALDVLDLVLISGLIYLLMRQVPSIAGGLGGGVAIAAAGSLGNAVAWSMRGGVTAGRGVYWAGKGMYRGLPYLGRGAAWAGRKLGGARANSVSPGAVYGGRNTVPRATAWNAI